jgi:ubiquinone/menaquinone biosynthesis C-methylase UbiE
MSWNNSAFATASPAMDRLNRTVYGKDSVATAYEQAHGLHEGEGVILEMIKPEIRGKKILDIGIGGGRTTRFLSALTTRYVAIDYSPAMVEAARRNFAISSIYCCDARDMRRFPDDAFDFILFSFNGLDYMPHADRLAALREVYRVLAPAGVFMFSSHNRSGDAAKAPWNQKNRAWSRRFVISCLKALVTMPRHWRMRRHELHENEYAILNDSALGYTLMTYYIDVAPQLAQLASIGFAGARAFDAHGRPTADDRESLWVYYLARK